MAFLFNLLEPFTVRSTSICRMLVLKRDAWTEMQASYPGDVSMVERAVSNELMARADTARNLPRHQDASRARLDAQLLTVYATYEDFVGSVMLEKQQDKVAELCVAAAAGNQVAMRRALAGGLNPNTGDYDRRTALHVAAAAGSSLAVSFLLEEGANPNCVDNFGITPLFEAARRGQDEVLNILLEAGGRLGLYEASVKTSKVELEAMMLEAGTDLQSHTDEAKMSAMKGSSEVTNSGGNGQRDAGSLLCQVASSGENAFLKRLLKCGLHPDAADYDGRTGLHLASSLGLLHMVEQLLEAGANPSVLDNFGRTPLLEAVRAKQEPCARALKRRGADFGFQVLRTGASLAKLTRQTSDSAALSRGAIHAGAEMCQTAFAGDDEYLRLLLQFGCPVDAADYDLRTAAHLCCAQGNFRPPWSYTSTARTSRTPKIVGGGPRCRRLRSRGIRIWPTPSLHSPPGFSSLNCFL